MKWTVGKLNIKCTNNKYTLSLNKNNFLIYTCAHIYTSYEYYKYNIL